MNETKKIQWDCEECGVPLPYPDCPDCGTVQKEIVTACNRDHHFEEMLGMLKRVSSNHQGDSSAYFQALRDVDYLLAKIESETGNDGV